MIKENIISFINDNPVCWLATSLNKQPYVRTMKIYKADESDLIFTTGKNKDLYKQIKMNTLVELCFFNKESHTQIRVLGEVKVVNDIKIKEEILTTKPEIKTIIEQAGKDIFCVFKVTNCRAHVWTKLTQELPKKYINLF